MPVISSSIISLVEQVDGRTLVTELHADHRGVEHSAEYLAAIGLDIDAVLISRGAKIGAAIDALDAVEAEAANFELSISQVAYARRFTSAERQAIYTAAKTNSAVEDFWNMLLLAKNGVHMSAPEVMEGLILFEQAGLIGVGRAAIIGAA